MSDFLNYLILGITRGSMYALIALGYTLVYGVLQLINFAHSEVFMSGAFGSYLVVHAIVGPVGLIDAGGAERSGGLLRPFLVSASVVPLLLLSAAPWQARVKPRCPPVDPRGPRTCPTS